MQRTLLITSLFFAACTATPATTGVCGDGEVDTGEQCDDGNTVSGDGCSAACTLESHGGVCGDGTVDPGEQCDDGNTASGDGCSSSCQTEAAVKHATTVHWSFKDLATNTATDCPAGFDTAEVSSQLLDGGGNPVGAPILDQFDCAAGAGTTAALSAGHYRTWVSITDTNGATTYAQSLAVTVDLTAVDGDHAFTLLNDGGYFSFQWDLVGDASGNPLTCADAAAAGGVEAVSTDVNDSTNATSDIFTCTDGRGITDGLLAGTYTISVDAMNSNMEAIGTANAITNDILDANRVTLVDPISIPITGL